MKRSLGPKTFVLPTPVWVIGTYDKSGKPNVMTAAWGGICCSKPPSIQISLRKATYSYGNIVERRAFTVNVPSERYAKEADYFGSVSGRDIDKLAVAGLTPTRSELVDAPYVEEFPLALECSLSDVHEIGLHTLFVGEIVDVKANESVLLESGVPDIKKIRPLVYSPETRVYHGIGRYLGKAYSLGKLAFES